MTLLSPSYVTAAKQRRKVPWWAMATLGLMPVWGLMYVRALTETPEVVEGPLGEGSLNLLADCQRAAAVAGGPFKFTVTSPYMLARTLLDHHYRDFDRLTMALGEVLAEQVKGGPQMAKLKAAGAEVEVK